MPLPANNQDWPPKPWLPVYAKYAEWSAWYSGDPQALAAVYGGQVQWRKRHAWWKFWTSMEDETGHYPTRAQLHVPLASDVAAINAALLFGEKPTILIAEAHEENAPSDAMATEDRLAEIIDAGDIHGRLVGAAESAAALGGVYIKVDWDKAIASVPLLTVVQADSAIPDWKHGILTGVTLWRVLERDHTTVWRHIERHETAANGTGLVLHGLYKGTDDKLGQQVALTERAETASYRNVVWLPFEGLGIRYIPNMSPNPLWRGSPLGRSDYHGVEGLFDALDETWTSWMRDIRLGKARLLVPEDYLRKEGGGFRFDLDQEVYVPLDTPDAGNAPITESQFAIRVEEHERTSNALIERIVSRAGYSPQTFGLTIEGRADAAAALRIRERRTLMTQQRKRAYWESPLADLLEMLLAVDKAEFKSGVTVYRPAVNMADSLTPDEIEMATAVKMIADAGAASTEVLVRMLHQGWTEDQVSAEVARIREEQGLYVPDALQVGIA